MTTDCFKHLESAALTDVGRKRKNNEDSLVSIPTHGVICVADGMGGSEAGEVASGAVVDRLKGAFDKLGAPCISCTRKAEVARKAIHESNLWIWQHAIDKGMKSCGTTVVMIVFDGKDPSRALALHAGDSRAYRYRRGKLTQITGDHSFAAATGVEDENLLPARFRSVITRAVGITQDLLVDETPVDVAEDDIFIVCSDGLTRMVPDKRITSILNQAAASSPDEITGLLVKEANTAGGHDNISVVLTKVGACEGLLAAADEVDTPTGDFEPAQLTADLTTASVAAPRAPSPPPEQAAKPTSHPSSHRSAKVSVKDPAAISWWKMVLLILAVLIGGTIATYFGYKLYRHLTSPKVDVPTELRESSIPARIEPRPDQWEGDAPAADVPEDLYDDE